MTQIRFVNLYDYHTLNILYFTENILIVDNIFITFTSMLQQA